MSTQKRIPTSCSNAKKFALKNAIKEEKPKKAAKVSSKYQSTPSTKPN
jgi:hypothetical protein